MTDLENPAVGGEPVQLSSLTARGLRFEWHEAVAVVQEIRSLMRGSEVWESDVVPDPEHIWVRSNGEMTVAPGTKRIGGSAGQPASTLARLLLSLVDEAQMPAQLRLLAHSANSPTPPYANVDEFSRALAYFERPGRSAAIQDLYRRWRALPLQTETPSTPGSTRTQQAESAEQPRPRSRRRAFVAVAAAVVLVAAGVAVWWFSGRPRLSQLSSAGEQASAIASRGVTAGKNLLASGISAVRERVVGTEPQPQPASPAEPSQTAGAPAARPAGGRVAAAGQKPIGRVAQPGPDQTVMEPLIPSIPGFRAFDLRAKMPPGNVGPVSDAPTAAARQLRVDEQLSVPTTDPSVLVYTAADQDVIPPAPIRPRLRTTLPPGTRVESLSVMDLLISESGDVMSVRLVPPARDVREAMMLSAAKTWRFSPATRNGRAVRFLKRIWVSMS
jgi:hypothetical protein